jgi:hypothetical protein
VEGKPEVAEPILRSVDVKLTPPPYPDSTRAGNYALAFDHIRINQSGTWIDADDDVRPWLLLLWFLAWQQIPCATLPNDDDRIAKLLRMPQGMFATHKKVLLGGWTLHSDGKLYHDYLTGCVLTMERDRRRYRERMQKHRAQVTDSDTVTRDTHVTHRASQTDVDVDVNSKAFTPVDNSKQSPTKIVGNPKPTARPGESQAEFDARLRQWKGP